MNTPVPQRAGRLEWIGLAVITLPCLLYSMDLTVLHLAIPSLVADLAPTNMQLLWIVDIYGFMVAGSLITMGTLGDRIGRRKLLLIGAAVFGLTSIFAAFATNANMLILARALLGIAGATLAPSTLSLIRNLFHDEKQRTVAIGVWGAGFAAGGAIGPVVGGVLLQFFWWGSVFLIAVPVMVLLLLVGPRLLPEFKDPSAEKLDIPSAILSTTTVLSVIYGLKSIAEHGVSLIALGAIAAGVVLGTLFVRRQQTLSHPFLDLKLFVSPRFLTAIVTLMMCTFVAFSSFLFNSQFLQFVLKLSPLEAGLWMLPSSIVVTLVSLGVPFLAHRFRPAYVIAVAILISTAGLLLMTQIGGANSLAYIVIGTVLLSIGLGSCGALLTDLVLSTAPPERAGSAAATSETGSELGGALGIAIMGSIAVAVFKTAMSGTLSVGLPSEMVDAAEASIGGAFAVAEQLPFGPAQALIAAAQAAYSQAFDVVVAINAALMFACALAVWLVLGRPEREPGESRVDESPVTHPARTTPAEHLPIQTS